MGSASARHGQVVGNIKRLGDHTVCDARISSASGNVVIGGGTGGYAPVSAEVSPMLVDIARDMAIAGTAVALGAGAGAAFAAAGWAGVGVFGLQAAGGLAGGIGGGLAGGAIGQALGGARGQAWGEAIGGVGGGVGGAIGAGSAADALATADARRLWHRCPVTYARTSIGVGLLMTAL